MPGEQCCTSAAGWFVTRQPGTVSDLLVLHKYHELMLCPPGTHGVHLGMSGESLPYIDSHEIRTGSASSIAPDNHLPLSPGRHNLFADSHCCFTPNDDLLLIAHGCARGRRLRYRCPFTRGLMVCPGTPVQEFRLVEGYNIRVTGMLFCSLGSPKALESHLCYSVKLNIDGVGLPGGVTHGASSVRSSRGVCIWVYAWIPDSSSQRTTTRPCC